MAGPFEKMDDTITEIRFPKLRKTQQRGSKPRCHLLTSGTKAEVARRLASVIEPWGEVLAEHSWMPNGFVDCEEAQLHRAEAILPSSAERDLLANWWLAVPGGKATTPNWDIASTCVIDGKAGLLLIEAKAHKAELRNEERGKPLGGEDNKGVSLDSRRNHVRIACSIEEAGIALSEQTGLTWTLSRDRCYQMANRFAWAWKLTEMGKPVILVYLGFVGCDEMQDGTGEALITDDGAWQTMVEDHSRSLFPPEAWNRRWRVHGQSFIPLIRTCNQRLVTARK